MTPILFRVKDENRYEALLPLRNPKVNLTNNIFIAEKREKRKRKFQKDEQYFSHYKYFLD